jgi:hypothetical protein
VQKIRGLMPDYMAMGEAGMAEMGAMEMPLPDNTLPMMTGEGPYGAMEMGGMFTTVKVRKGLARDDYKDPGWYKQPPGTQANRVDSALARCLARRAAEPTATHSTCASPPATSIEEIAMRPVALRRRCCWRCRWLRTLTVRPRTAKLLSTRQGRATVVRPRGLIPRRRIVR